MGNLEDLTGKIYGDYKVVKFDNSKGKYKYYWICECMKCGKEKSIATNSLKTGKSIRCTCNATYNYPKEIKGFQKDLTGQKFGKLTVENFEYKKHTHSYWKCRCDCGSIVIKPISYLNKSKFKRCDSCRKEYTQKSIKPSKEKVKIPIPFDLISYNTKENIYSIKGDITTINEKILVDTKNLDKILSFKRYVSINSSGYPYMNWRGRELFLHRLILDLPQSYDRETGLIGEHINGIRTECLESNLRIAKAEFNPINCKIYKNNTSGHKGVSWNKDRKKWQVTINYNKKQIYLGIYENKEEAIKIRKDAELKYFGEYRRDEENLHNGQYS